MGEAAQLAASRPGNSNNPIPTPAGEPTSERQEKSALLYKLKAFLKDSLNSKAVVSALLVSVLLSFSLGLTVGIVPEILTDRYARIYHGYGSVPSSDGKGDGLQPLPPCWNYEISNMPEACRMGADDAQTGSAYGMLVQNLLTFFFNAVLGSYSDKEGRRPLLLISVFLNALVPAAVLSLQLFETMNPFWYYATNAITGFISFNSVVFTMLSDDCPEEQRAGRFAVNMAGFYVGFCAAPQLTTYMSHIVASWWSFALAIVVVVYSIVSVPETLPSLLANINNDNDDLIFSGREIRDDNAAERESLINGERIASVSHFVQATKTLLWRPFLEMAILLRDGLKLLAIGSFLSAAVFSVDSSLVLFYIEEYLNVREADIAIMFFIMGILGVILQGFSLQPLVYLLGEKGLLVVSFCSGTVHNLLYGIASTKSEITVALGLSQLTKLSYPLLSSLASQQVGLDEQGRAQGALLALNALAGALGPVSMNWVYERTKDGSHKPFGPGTMFLLSSGLYFLGTLVVSQIPSSKNAARGSSDTSEQSTSSSEIDIREESILWQGDDLEEPLLLRLGETITI